MDWRERQWPTWQRDSRVFLGVRYRMMVDTVGLTLEAAVVDAVAMARAAGLTDPEQAVAEIVEAHAQAAATRKRKG